MNNKLLFHLIVCCLLLPAQTSANKISVWLDTDMLFGKTRKDVDDGLALMMALGSDTLHIVGISLIDKVDYGEKITRKFLKWYAAGEIPVYKGVNSLFLMGEKTDAVEGLAAALRQQRLTIVGLGPATNIATTLQLYPELADSIERIVLCMGRQPGVHFNPGNGKKNLNDYNFDLAPDAVEFLLSTNVPLVLCGYEASSSVYLHKSDYQFLKKTGERHNRKVYRRLKHWAFGWKIFLGSKKGFIPFDAVTLTYVLNPELLEIEYDVPVAIETLENDTGFRNFGKEKKYLLASREFDNERKVNFCTGSNKGMKNIILISLRNVTLETLSD